MNSNDENYTPPGRNVYGEIQKQLKFKDNLGESRKFKKGSFVRKKKKDEVCPTDAMRATAYTTSKDLSLSLHKMTSCSYIKDNRDVTELITTVKHAKKQGCTDSTAYHCVKVR